MNPHLRHTVGAAVFCTALLVVGFALLFHTSAAKSDPIVGLLNLPAPPPPNPAVPVEISVDRSPDFYLHPPPDDAPIEDLVAYWTHIASRYYRPGQTTPINPSEKVTERLVERFGDEPESIYEFLRILPTNAKTAASVKAVYDKLTSEKDDNAEDANNTVEGSGYQTTQLKGWLIMNSPYFAGELEQVAQKTKDDETHYVDVTSEQNVLALTTQDWQRADPLVTRMYGDHSQPVTQVLATWALYKHALDTDSSGDIERYRGELMRMVEDRSLPDGMRDKANDALTHEKAWPGREDWTASLFEDETLVNMQRFTMLTTLMTYDPSEKYIERLTTLLEKTSKPTVRSAAVRSLVIALPTMDDPPKERSVLSAMLPWLDDPQWAGDVPRDRSSLISKLATVEMPEAVPALIKLLDEKHTVSVPDYDNPNNPMHSPMYANTNRAVANAMYAEYAAMRAANAAVSAARRVSNASANTAADDDPVRMKTVEEYTYRDEAVTALAMQHDARAVPALRRVLNSIDPARRQTVVYAIYKCGGFTIPDQVDAIDLIARQVMEHQADPINGYDGSNAMSNAANGAYSFRFRNDNISPVGPPSPVEIRTMLGRILMTSGGETPDELARAVVNRIADVDKQDPQISAAYRSVIMRWPNAAVNVLLLHDVKLGNATTEILLRLLSSRRELKAKQPTDLFDIRTGVPSAVGLAPCLLEDKGDAATLLDSENAETKAALMACSRMTRLPLDVQKVAALLSAKEPIVAQAAEEYLVSQDSPAARSAVLSKHPGEARILGARLNFPASAQENVPGAYVWLSSLFYLAGGYGQPFTPQTEDNPDAILNKSERSLQEELEKDESLIGIYAFDGNYIRMYRDRVIYSWDDDESRYYERPLAAEEFEEIKSLLAAKHADEQPPFLYCSTPYCGSRELLMIGRNGGRRVYIAGEAKHKGAGDLFPALATYFTRLRESPGRLKYSLSRELPGLEILLADKDLHAETVWKNGDDLRIAVKSLVVRQSVNDQITKAKRAAAKLRDDAPEDATLADADKTVTALTTKTDYEGYSWHRVANGVDGGPVPQPNDVEYIPFRDGLPAQPTAEQWKGRGNGFEVRSGDEGLYMISRGQSTLLQKGNFDTPIIVSANGRWIVARDMGSDDSGAQLLRINLATKKSFPVTATNEAETGYEPVVYIPSINRVLVVKARDYYGTDEAVEQDQDDRTSVDDEPSSLALLDPDTGTITEAKGEFRPLSQQIFRPLQKTGNGKYWAAMPDHAKGATSVGIYDSGGFTFKPLIAVPHMLFNSMDMWVDEPQQKLYFVYRGHLLSLPLKVEQALPAARSPVRGH